MIRIAQSQERINSQGGLQLVGKLTAELCPMEKFFPRREGQHRDALSDAELIKTQIGLFATAHSHYDDIETLREPANRKAGLGEVFAKSMGTAFVPCASRLRSGLKALAKCGEQSLQRLGAANLCVLQSQLIETQQHAGLVFTPCDIDVTVFDNEGSAREGLGHTYKGCKGFAPIFAYIGAQGLVLDHQLRPGVQHCQKETPEFLQGMLKRLESLKLQAPALIRMDSGNDSADTLAVLRRSGQHFIVKRNLRKEPLVKYLDHALAQQSKPERPREGKEVYHGTLEHMRPGGENSTQEPLTMAYRVIRRTINSKGEALLIDDVEVETYWTNLWLGAEDIVELYHQHGTSEQFHSELKSDLGLERFPARSYAVNQQHLSIGILTYNLLRSIEAMARQERPLWPSGIKKVSRRRVGSIVHDLILVGAKLVRHAGKEILRVAAHWSWTSVLIAVTLRVEGMGHASGSPQPSAA
jgi:hypothetical protein